MPSGYLPERFPHQQLIFTVASTFLHHVQPLKKSLLPFPFAILRPVLVPGLNEKKELKEAARDRDA